jgi:lauroyl/myristoyl acyltransferase
MTTRELTYLGFALIWVAAFALALVSHLPRSPIPTLGVLFARLMRRRVTRVALVLAWWWIGFHFFVR